MSGKRQPTIAGPWAAGGLTFLLAVVGATGSAFSENIRATFLSPWKGEGMDWPSSLFWMALGLTSLIFGYRQHTVDALRQRYREDIDRATGDIQLSLRTMPPVRFLEQFCVEYQGFANEVMVFLASSDSRDREKIVAHIRKALLLLTYFVRLFDDGEDHIRYAANVMIPLDPSRDDFEEQEVQKRLTLCEDETDVKRLAFVLDMDTELSVVDGSETRDDTLRPLALAVPKEPKTATGKWRMLFGAPMAFWEARFDLVPDVGGYIQELPATNDFTEGLQGKIIGFFESSDEVRSFLSMPLSLEEWPPPRVGAKTPRELAEELDQRRRQIVAIVNIHRDQPDLCKGNDKSAGHFAMATSPLRRLLTRLLLQLREIEGGNDHWTARANGVESKKESSHASTGDAAAGDDRGLG